MVTQFNRLFKFFCQPIVIFIYAILMAACYYLVDRQAASFFNKNLLNLNSSVLVWFTHLGISTIYLIVFLLTALFFRYKHYNQLWESRAWFLFCCIALPNFICFILKICLGRARPILLFTEHLYGFYGIKFNMHFWSFPSGHTTTVIGLASGLSLIWTKWSYFIISIACLVAFSRVLLTLHYVSDVLVAIYLTIIEIGLFMCFVKNNKCFTLH